MRVEDLGISLQQTLTHLVTQSCQTWDPYFHSFSRLHHLMPTVFFFFRCHPDYISGILQKEAKLYFERHFLTLNKLPSKGTHSSCMVWARPQTRKSLCLKVEEGRQCRLASEGLFFLGMAKWMELTVCQVGVHTGLLFTQARPKKFVPSMHLFLGSY